MKNRSINLENNSNTIPTRFKKYFWDCDFEDLSMQKNAFFIIERILNFGDVDSVKWILSNTDRKMLVEVVERSRNLNKKTKNYWRIMLGG